MENYKYQIDLETESELRFTIKTNNGITIGQNVEGEVRREYGFIDPYSGLVYKLKLEGEKVLVVDYEEVEVPILLFVDGILIV